MIKYSKHKEKYPIEVRYNKVRKIVLEVLKAFNVTIKKENFEEFNDFKSKNRLIVCNHLSLIDPLIIIAVSEKPVTFACKKEVLKLPLVPRIVNILDGYKFILYRIQIVNESSVAGRSEQKLSLLRAERTVLEVNGDSIS